MEATGKVVYINDKKNSIKIDSVEGFLSVFPASEMAKTIAQLSVGDTVSLTYVENGKFKNIKKIEKTASKKVEAPLAPAATKPTQTSSYSYEDKSLQIMKGNALNAAAAVLAGTDAVRVSSVEEVIEMTKLVANSLFDYLRG